MSISLYEINLEIEKTIQNAVDIETGEITGDLSNLDSLQMAKDEKVDNIACYIKNLKAEAEAIRAEEKKLADRRRACENHADRLKRYLADNLQGEKFKSPRVSISWRKSEAVEIEDLWKIPDDYLKYSDPTPDKTAIREAIKKGFDVDGAELVTNLNMTIR